MAITDLWTLVSMFYEFAHGEPQDVTSVEQALSVLASAEAVAIQEWSAKTHNL